VRMTRKLRTVLVVAAVAVGLPLAALAFGRSNEGSGAASDALWQAIVAVESKGDVHAYNAHDGATGMAQIRSICLEDANRIAGLRGLETRFTASDRHNPKAARRIWNLYLGYYGKQYEKETGRKPTDEVFARIWNGGPTGWRKSSTRPYWGRVREAMKSAPAKEAPSPDEAEGR
jgi:hypothetical protein